MSERLCRQALAASIAIDPVANLGGTLRCFDAFQVCSTHYFFIAVFDDKRMPGADGEIGQIALNMLGDALQ
ncbi:hypothetical protein D3C73_1351580 [compost metagenome]